MDGEAERQLWCAVLATEFEDATRWHRPDLWARRRLVNMDWETRIICEFAGFDPEAVRDSARKMEANHWNKRIVIYAHPTKRGQND